MSLRRARTLDEDVERIRQAVSEAAGLRDCLEYEIEDMARFPACLDPLQEGMQALYDAMKGGTYAFGREDLPFVDLAGKYAEEIPFHTLLKHFNETPVAGSVSAGLMPEKGAMNIAERVSFPAPRLEG
jgi:hypothetical protein